jgi:hypothetical protein
MSLKWISALVAVGSLTAFATANTVMAFAPGGGDVPVVVNLVLVAGCAAGAVLAVVAELYERIDNRLTVLSDFLVTRLTDLETSAGDRNAGFVEGYLASQAAGDQAPVVPIPSRGQRPRAVPSPLD